MKKVFSMLACMLLALGLVPNVAFATGENEAKIGNTEYATLQEALEHASDNDTVTLLKDVTTEGVTLGIDTDIILDLGGHTYTNVGGTVINLYSAMTLRNGKLAMTGANNTVAIWMRENAKLHVALDAQVVANDSVEGASWAVGMAAGCDGAELTVDGILGGEAGFTVNGTIKQENLTTGNKVYINESALIDTKYYGLYLAGYADTVVNQATISGETGIEIRAGNLTLNDATIRGTGSFEEGSNPGGTTTTGVALAVSQHTTNQPINVTINGGFLSGAKALHEVDLQDEVGAEKVVLNVAGGSFQGAVESENHTEFISAGTFDRPVANEYIVTGKTEASLTSGENTTYFVGDSDQVAAEIAAAVQSGDTIEVTQGDLTLVDLPAGVTVKNTGAGKVTANHMVATPEGVTTVAVTETDSAGVSPQTGDLVNPVALGAVLTMASLVFAGAYLSSRKARR